MAIGCYDDVRLLAYYAEREFKAVLDEHGRRAPSLARVSTERLFQRSEIGFKAEFSNGLQRDWLIEEHRFSEQGRRDVLHPSVELELRSLYSRLYEDHLIELDVRVAREAYVGVISTTSDPEARRAAARMFDNTERMIRETHRGRSQSWMFGLDRARGDDRIAMAIRPQLRGRRVDLEITDDVVVADYSYTTTVMPIAENNRLTAIQVQAMTEMMRQMSVDHDAMIREYFNLTGLPGTWLNGDVGDEKAQQKGLALLKDWLTPQQRADYECFNWFEVKGGATGKRYRIKHGRQQNIEELDERGCPVAGLCFLPEGQLVAGDVMLAQKIALETNERGALAVANRF